MTVDPEGDFDTLEGIKRVAVIGAGASGCPAARHLRAHGLAVRVFERQPCAGGIWTWSESVAPLPLPTPPPSRAAFDPARPGDGVFSPPNPVYANLSNNVPTSTMVFKDFAYPAGTAENVPHTVLAQYIRDYTRHFNLDALISYDTRVESAVKEGAEWVLRLRHKEGKVWEERFDALVVATGHYNAPFVPRIPGLGSGDEDGGWAARWPSDVIHTTAYRRPETYAGKTVLLVGLGTSGLDIARDLVNANPPPFTPPDLSSLSLSSSPALSESSASTSPSDASTPATSVDEHEPSKPTTVYISARDPYGPAQYRAQRSSQRRLAPGTLLPEIAAFQPPKATLAESEIRFQDGSVRSGFDAVIFATGYQYSFPFLPQFHRDPAPSSAKTAHAEEEAEREENTEGDGDKEEALLVTDGKGVHNLYRDVFFVPDPTLAFVGVSVNTSAFSFFEYQSLAVARVLSGRARLPALPRRRRLYKEWVRERGAGKFAHLMGIDRERAYVRETVEWLNEEGERSGAEKVEGHSREWLEASDRFKALIAQRWRTVSDDSPESVTEQSLET